MDFGFCPDERLRIFVVGFDERINVLLELFDGGERCAGQRLALQDGEPALDLIEPRGACRRKVESYKRVAFQPFVVLLVRLQIVEDDLEPCLWIGGDEVIHEVEKFLAATAFLVRGPDLAGRNLKGGKQVVAPCRL